MIIGAKSGRGITHQQLLEYLKHIEYVMNYKSKKAS